MHPAGKEATPPVMLTLSLIQFKQAIIMKLDQRGCDQTSTRDELKGHVADK